MLSGTFSGIEVAFAHADHDRGGSLDVFAGMPDAERDSSATEWAVQRQSSS